MSATARWACAPGTLFLRNFKRNRAQDSRLFPFSNEILAHLQGEIAETVKLGRYVVTAPISPLIVIPANSSVHLKGKFSVRTNPPPQNHL
jgi:hypothetical protein